MEKETLIIRDENDNEDAGYNRDNCIIRYDGEDFLMLHKYGIDTNRRYYSLSNYQRAVNMVGIEDKYNRIYKYIAIQRYRYQPGIIYFRMQRLSCRTGRYF